VGCLGTKENDRVNDKDKMNKKGKVRSTGSMLDWSSPVTPNRKVTIADIKEFV